MPDDNPFLAYGRSQAPDRPQHVRVTGKVPDVLTPHEKEMRDAEVSLRKYLKRKRQEHKQLLEGQWRDQVRELDIMLAHLDLDGARGILRYMHSVHWFKSMPQGDRYLILEQISAAIVKARFKAGKPPFSDPLPGEPDDLFRIARKNLGDPEQ